MEAPTNAREALIEMARKAGFHDPATVADKILAELKEHGYEIVPLQSAQITKQEID